MVTQPLYHVRLGILLLCIGVMQGLSIPLSAQRTPGTGDQQEQFKAEQQLLEEGVQARHQVMMTQFQQQPRMKDEHSDEQTGEQLLIQPEDAVSDEEVVDVFTGLKQAESMGGGQEDRGLTFKDPSRPSVSVLSHAPRDPLSNLNREIITGSHPRAAQDHYHYQHPPLPHMASSSSYTPSLVSEANTEIFTGTRAELNREVISGPTVVRSGDTFTRGAACDGGGCDTCNIPLCASNIKATVEANMTDAKAVAARALEASRVSVQTQLESAFNSSLSRVQQSSKDADKRVQELLQGHAARVDQSYEAGIGHLNSSQDSAVKALVEIGEQRQQHIDVQVQDRQRDFATKAEVHGGGAKDEDFNAAASQQKRNQVFSFQRDKTLEKEKARVGIERMIRDFRHYSDNQIRKLREQRNTDNQRLRGGGGGGGSNPSSGADVFLGWYGDWMQRFWQERMDMLREQYRSNGIELGRVIDRALGPLLQLIEAHGLEIILHADDETQNTHQHCMKYVNVECYKKEVQEFSDNQYLLIEEHAQQQLCELRVVIAAEVKVAAEAARERLVTLSEQDEKFVAESEAFSQNILQTYSQFASHETQGIVNLVEDQFRTLGYKFQNMVPQTEYTLVSRDLQFPKRSTVTTTTTTHQRPRPPVRLPKAHCSWWGCDNLWPYDAGWLNPKEGKEKEQAASKAVHQESSLRQLPAVSVETAPAPVPIPQSQGSSTVVTAEQEAAATALISKLLDSTPADQRVSADTASKAKILLRAALA